MKKNTKTTRAAAAKKKAVPDSSRYTRRDQGEDIAIIDQKTGKAVALVPYRPSFGAASCDELYRDRLSEKEARLISAKIAKALNFLK